jgi:hypothetical protein
MTICAYARRQNRRIRKAISGRAPSRNALPGDTSRPDLWAGPYLRFRLSSHIPLRLLLYSITTLITRDFLVSVLEPLSPVSRPFGWCARYAHTITALLRKSPRRLPQLRFTMPINRLVLSTKESLRQQHRHETSVFPASSPSLHIIDYIKLTTSNSSRFHLI